MNTILFILFVSLIHINILAYSIPFFVATIPAFILLGYMLRVNKLNNNN